MGHEVLLGGTGIGPETRKKKKNRAEERRERKSEITPALL
jgi:hypothetical protein